MRHWGGQCSWIHATRRAKYGGDVEDREDRYNLGRFVDAQDDVYPTVLTELRAGMKRSHWMWFIFPQVRGLGTSATAQHFAITDLDEATAYLAHPVLGQRLVECADLVVAIVGASLDRILGWPDNLKFHSSITLFSLVPDHNEVFDAALAKYFDGTQDARTLALTV